MTTKQPKAATPNPLAPRGCCLECGRSLATLGLRKGATFCGADHRKAWNNRRMVRGSELYDLFMAMGYERDKRKSLDLFTTLNRLARAFRDSDKSLRDGRRSWDVDAAIERMTIAYSDEGDKR